MGFLRLRSSRAGPTTPNVEVVAGDSRTAIAFERELADLVAGEYVYVRAVQEDDGAAWSSPFFVDPPAPTR